MQDEEKLAQIRQQIDDVDAELQRLLNRRATLACEVAQAKGEQPDTGAYYRPEREAGILRTVTARNEGPLSNEQVAAVFREIMSACLALQQPLQVAYLGPQGTFTQAAVHKHFGHAAGQKALDSIEAVFREVEAGTAHFGVVPIENSSSGGINHSVDRLLSSPLHICGEVEMRIHHHLLSAAAEKGAIQRIYSHEQALLQCRNWLDENLPGVERIAVTSNAEGARRAAGEPDAAAIAGDAAAELYVLGKLASNIEDHPDNTTRFFVIGRQQVARSGNDKTSLVFSTPNKPGALHAMLGVLAKNAISMTRIESRPSQQGTWDYVFFVDIEGHVEDATVARAVETLTAQAAMLKVLGSYPRAVL